MRFEIRLTFFRCQHHSGLIVTIRIGDKHRALDFIRAFPIAKVTTKILLNIVIKNVQIADVVPYIYISYLPVKDPSTSVKPLRRLGGTNKEKSYLLFLLLHISTLYISRHL